MMGDSLPEKGNKKESKFCPVRSRTWWPEVAFHVGHNTKRLERTLTRAQKEKNARPCARVLSVTFVDELWGGKGMRPHGDTAEKS